jgi:hypothetical protein
VLLLLHASPTHPHDDVAHKLSIHGSCFHFQLHSLTPPAKLEKIVRLHNDTIVSPPHLPITTHARACATLRESYWVVQARGLKQSKLHYAERIRTQAPSVGGVSSSVWAHCAHEWIAMLLRHSRNPNPSSIETLIYSHQTYSRDWKQRLSPCLKGIFPETRNASSSSTHSHSLTTTNPYFMLTSNIPIHPSQKQAFPSLPSIKGLTLTTALYVNLGNQQPDVQYVSDPPSSHSSAVLGLAWSRKAFMRAREDPATLVPENNLTRAWYPLNPKPKYHRAEMDAWT